MTRYLDSKGVSLTYDGGYPLDTYQLDEFEEVAEAVAGAFPGEPNAKRLTDFARDVRAVLREWEALSELLYAAGRVLEDWGGNDLSDNDYLREAVQTPIPPQDED